MTAEHQTCSGIYDGLLMDLFHQVVYSPFLSCGSNYETSTSTSHLPVTPIANAESELEQGIFPNRNSPDSLPNPPVTENPLDNSSWLLPTLADAFPATSNADLELEQVRSPNENTSGLLPNLLADIPVDSSSLMIFPDGRLATNLELERRGSSNESYSGPLLAFDDSSLSPTTVPNGLPATGNSNVEHGASPLTDVPLDDSSSTLATLAVHFPYINFNLSPDASIAERSNAIGIPSEGRPEIMRVSFTNVTRSNPSSTSTRNEITTTFQTSPASTITRLLPPPTASTAPSTHLCSYPNCDRVFKTTGGLKSHEFSHTKIKPWRCDCGSAFSRIYDLERHKRHHNCSSEGNIKVVYDRHKSTIRCQLCSETFSRPDALQRHLRSTKRHTSA